MGTRSGLGEFEQLVLLAVLQLGDDAYGPEISSLLEDAAGREVSRGALYSSLERLERKAMLKWNVEALQSGQRGTPMRRFTVTRKGKEALRNHREALLTLWAGLEKTLSPNRGRS